MAYRAPTTDAVYEAAQRYAAWKKISVEDAFHAHNFQYAWNNYIGYLQGRFNLNKKEQAQVERILGRPFSKSL